MLFSFQVSRKVLPVEVALWQKAVLAVGDITKGPVMPRTVSDWRDVCKQETVKLSKKSAKVLWGDLADKFLPTDDEPSIPRTNDFFLPEQVVELLKNSKTKEDFMTGTASLKKDLACEALAVLQVLQEQNNETSALEKWESDLEKMLANVAEDEQLGGDDGLPPFQLGQVAEVHLTVPKNPPNKQHWEVQRAAAYASWCILGKYVESADLPKEITGLESFHDMGLEYVTIVKNKPALVLDSVQTLRDCVGPSIRLCFVGRVLPLPRGQPSTFLRSKMRVE